MALIENIGAYSSWRNIHSDYEKLEGDEVIKVYVHNKYADITETKSRIGFGYLENISDKIIESSSEYRESISYWISTGFFKVSIGVSTELDEAMTFWILTLSIMDLSKAYPLLSLNYVLVLLVSHYRLQERIMCKQVVGVTFILFGVFLLGIG